MKRFHVVTSLAFVAVAAAGCGDNSRTCGPGTMDVDGVCTPEGNATCGDGTKLDPDTGTCVIDPNSCQGGTVLIGTTCQDPTKGLTVDVEEAAEPNGIGVAGGIESDAQAPAGQVTTIKPIGMTTVLHGHITPWRDKDQNGQTDPDFDTYVIQIHAPTLMEISVDGVGGLQGAFYMIGDPAGDVPAFERYGINLSGDTSKRQVFFPAAGLYAFAVGDTRSMYVGNNPPNPAGFGGAAGGPNAEYYVSLSVIATPTPTDLTVTSGEATQTGTLGTDEVKFYAMPMGLGINEVTNAMNNAAASVIVMNGDNFRAYADRTLDFLGNPLPADAIALGFKTGDKSVIVVDAAYNYGPDPDGFTLHVTTGDAVALCPDSGVCSAHVASAPELSDAPASFFDLNVYYYDVAADNETDGIDLAWNHSVDGLIIDQQFFIFARFTYNSGFNGDTWDGYRGLLRHPKAGRYYVMVYDPFGATTDTLTATTTLTTATVATITEGTPVTGQALDATAKTAPFSYNPAASDVWQVFGITGTGTGAVTAKFYKQTTAFGRLGDVASCTFCVDDAPVIFSKTYPADVDNGRIVAGDGTTQFFGVASTANDAGTLALDFHKRDYTDLGTIANGMMVNKPGETLDATTTHRFYLARTTSGLKVDLLSHPVTGTLNTEIKVFNADENPIRIAFNNPAAGGDDSGHFLQNASGFTAFAVDSPVALPAGTSTYDLTIGAVTFTAPTYTRAAATIAFVDACVGGTTQPQVPDATIFGGVGDEAFTANPIATPANFSYFGLSVPNIVVSANGWLSFDAPTDDAHFSNATMPTPGVPNAVIAPFWDDLDGITICTKATGSQLVVQWSGHKFSPATQIVSFQAILDGSTNQISFVYGPTHTANSNTATVGIEDQVGATANLAGFNVAGTTPASSAMRFTPN